MSSPEETPVPMEGQALGAEVPAGDNMLQVVMNELGAAQAQLRDAEYKVIAVTPIVGPPVSEDTSPE